MANIHMYLLKVTEFCNLNCPYCYMFNLRDTTFLKKPKVMSFNVVEETARKIVALAKEQGVHRLTISLHGGEPMLAGREWLAKAVAILRETAGDDLKLNFFMQTNGLLIDDKWLDFFEEQGIKVGLSMDGTKEVHDRNRIDFAGRGSYDRTIKSLAKLRQRNKVFTGVLCVMDPTTDGLGIYRHFRDLGVDRFDFLWPLENNWNQPPEQLESATPYADYLIPIFDEWWHEDNKQVRIRYFSQILDNLFGMRGGLDSLGGNPVSITTIDSDGSIEPVDSLRACDDGLTNLGLNILKDPLTALYEQPVYQAAIAGQDGLCDMCLACPLHDVCGGGYMPHRYSTENQFRNPSVYCRDLWKLITHMLAVVNHEMAEAELAPLPAERLQEIAEAQIAA